MTAWIILIYGALTALGGLFGYVKAGSTISLISGGMSGLLLIIASTAMWKGAYSAGWWLAMIVTLVLLVNFGVRSYQHFKLMPGGVMLILSAIAFIALINSRRP
ncbi:MAG: TMEM14 family protein [Pyrinomonadaceae bacterium]